MARTNFVEDHIGTEGIDTSGRSDTPSKTSLLVTHKDGFKTTRTGFSALLQWNNRKTQAPPYVEMGQVRLNTMDTFVGRDTRRKSRCWKMIAKILDSENSITPKLVW